MFTTVARLWTILRERCLNKKPDDEGDDDDELFVWYG